MDTSSVGHPRPAPALPDPTGRPATTRFARRQIT